MSIIVENLSKHYGTQKAVDNISFKVESGQILGFLGPNGAGKTTTMKMLTCYIAPSGGNATVYGKSIKNDQEAVKKSIGYLPEHNPLYLDMPVIEYLEFSAAMQGVPKSQINQAVKNMLVTCGLGAEKHKNIGELSKGYRQRVGLAQAMIHDPDVLILDEPTTGLDPNQIIEIRKLIKEIGQKKTVIFSTHILSEVEATCDRVMIINKGRIIEDSTPELIRKKATGGEVLHITIEDAPNADTVIQQLNTVATVQSVTEKKEASNGFVVESKPEESSRKAVFKQCVANNWTLTEMRVEETSLEDIFRTLTRN
ncbi:MAG: ATP-binding cassette domain-containing protein [Bacteroidetes bacterium]|nr:ATP-binding cassette domain-containing protein [Bacteroidota bacterium]